MLSEVGRWPDKNIDVPCDELNPKVLSLNFSPSKIFNSVNFEGVGHSNT